MLPSEYCTDSSHCRGCEKYTPTREVFLKGQVFQKSVTDIKDQISGVLSKEIPVRGELKALSKGKPLSDYACSVLEYLVEGRTKWEEELYHQDEARAKTFSFKPDPVIQAMSAPGHSKTVLRLSEQFQKEGMDRFACPEFRVTLENMLICLESDISEASGVVRDELEALKQAVETMLAGDQALPFKPYFLLCFKFTVIRSTLKRMYFSQSAKEKAMKQLSALDYSLVFEDMDKFRENYKKVRGTNSDNPTLLFKGMEKALRKCPECLPWPSFEPLDEAFFTKALRYPVYPMGISSQAWGFHDSILMTIEHFFAHDGDHAREVMALFIFGVPLAELSAEAHNRIVTIMDLLDRLDLDRHTTRAFWLLLFQLHHEIPEPLISAETTLAEIEASLDSFIFDVQAGSYPVDKGFNVEHIQAAELIIERLPAVLEGLRDAHKFLISIDRG